MKSASEEEERFLELLEEYVQAALHWNYAVDSRCHEDVELAAAEKATARDALLAAHRRTRHR